jgi:hypothetical protein
MKSNSRNKQEKFDPIKINDAIAAVMLLIHPDRYSMKEIRAVLVSVLAFTLSELDPLGREIELLRANRILRGGDRFLRMLAKDAAALKRAGKRGAKRGE